MPEYIVQLQRTIVLAWTMPLVAGDTFAVPGRTDEAVLALPIPDLPGWEPWCDTVLRIDEALHTPSAEGATVLVHRMLDFYKMWHLQAENASHAFAHVREAARREHAPLQDTNAWSVLRDEIRDGYARPVA